MRDNSNIKFYVAGVLVVTTMFMTIGTPNARSHRQLGLESLLEEEAALWEDAYKKLKRAHGTLCSGNTAYAGAVYKAARDQFRQLTKLYPKINDHPEILNHVKQILLGIRWRRAVKWVEINTVSEVAGNLKAEYM